jgi:hypothetical protein
MIQENTANPFATDKQSSRNIDSGSSNGNSKNISK